MHRRNYGQSPRRILANLSSGTAEDWRVFGAVQGAVVVLHPQTGAVLGAIGVSGLSAQEDEDLAKLGLQTLGL